ncbi:MAG: hypothetical protein Q4G49_09450 [Paracoccus sp. (in: a-proteobacteria)]|nr:hypothetical protein [Paracoccus sp. (in: a-proteobacteria)]
MSAPHTDPERQVRRHRGPVVGMILIIILTAVAFVWWLRDETDNPEMPGTDPVGTVTTPGPGSDVAVPPAAPRP